MQLSDNTPCFSVEVAICSAAIGIPKKESTAALSASNLGLACCQHKNPIVQVTNVHTTKAAGAVSLAIKG